MRYIKIFDSSRVFIGEIEADNGRVFRADPKLAFMLRWNGQRVADHCRGQGWSWLSRKASAAVAANYAKQRSDAASRHYCQQTAVRKRLPHKRRRRD